MKLFDYAIGNPPYNDSFGILGQGENDNYAAPVYNEFMDAAYKIADKVELIHPARFLFNAGSTPKKWNEKMLSDPHFKVMKYEEDATKVFANTDIKGGIAITYRDANKNYGSIDVFVKYKELKNIAKKASPESANDSITSIIYTQNRFDLEEMYKFNPEIRKNIGSEGKDKRLRNNTFEKVPLFKEEKTPDSISVIGVIKNTRKWMYIQRKYIDTNHENLSKWKVIVPRANGKGTLSDIFSSPIVIGPNEGYTQTFLGIGAFDKKNEANNLLKYIKTKFLRALLCVLKADQHNERNTWRHIPLQNFSDNSDINWSKSIPEIDQQLYEKYGLSKGEIEFIETHVKEMV